MLIRTKINHSTRLMIFLLLFCGGVERAFAMNTTDTVLSIPLRNGKLMILNSCSIYLAITKPDGSPRSTEMEADAIAQFILYDYCLFPVSQTTLKHVTVY